MDIPYIFLIYFIFICPKYFPYLSLVCILKVMILLSKTYEFIKDINLLSKTDDFIKHGKFVNKNGKA